MSHDAVNEKAPLPELDLTPPTKEAAPKAEKPKKEAKPKAEKVKAEKKPETEKAPSSKTKLSKTYPEDAKLELLAESNPKKPGTRAHDIFEFYKGADTVGDFFAATAGYVSKSGKKQPGTYSDITYDVGHGYIKVG